MFHIQKRKAIFILATVLAVPARGFALAQITNTIHLRANQIGYLPDDEKIAIAFSRDVIDNKQFEIIDMPNSSPILSSIMSILVTLQPTSRQEVAPPMHRFSWHGLSMMER